MAILRSPWPLGPVTISGPYSCFWPGLLSLLLWSQTLQALAGVCGLPSPLRTEHGQPLGRTPLGHLSHLHSGQLSACPLRPLPLALAESLAQVCFLISACLSSDPLSPLPICPCHLIDYLSRLYFSAPGPLSACPSPWPLSFSPIVQMPPGLCPLAL